MASLHNPIWDLPNRQPISGWHAFVSDVLPVHRYAITDQNGVILYATNSAIRARAYHFAYRRLQVRAYDRHAVVNKKNRQSFLAKKFGWLEGSDGLFNMEVSLPFHGRPFSRVFVYRNTEGFLTLIAVDWTCGICQMPDGRFRRDYPNSDLMKYLPFFPEHLYVEAVESLLERDEDLAFAQQTFAQFREYQEKAYPGSTYL